MYLNTGYIGTSLKDILNYYDNKNWETIMVRCRWTSAEGESQDDLIGFCSYINKKLIPLDGDSYSLNDLYEDWKIENNTLIVWENGFLSHDIIL